MLGFGGKKAENRADVLCNNHLLTPTVLWLLVILFLVVMFFHTNCVIALCSITYLNEIYTRV